MQKSADTQVDLIVYDTHLRLSAPLSQKSILLEDL